MRKYIMICLVLVCCMLVGSGCGSIAGTQDGTAPVISSVSEIKALQGTENRFYFNLLDDMEKIWYNDFCRFFGNFDTKGEFDKRPIQVGYSDDVLDKIFQYVKLDHPEFFYTEGYRYTTHMLGGSLVSIDFSGDYLTDKDTSRAKAKKIYEAARRIINCMPPEYDEYEKTKYIYETIILETSYDIHATDNQNMYSVLVNGASVCHGYTSAMQYLLNAVGIPCTIITGTIAGGESHSWNLVLIDGAYYLLDATWGDAQYTGNSPKGANRILYDYLNVTGNDLKKTHFADNPDIVPSCISRDANYFVREGCYINGYDEEQMSDLFWNAINRGDGSVHLRCSSDECFSLIHHELIDNTAVFRFYSNIEGSIAYREDMAMRTMSFWVTN